jgi:hypothetical protein
MAKHITGRKQTAGVKDPKTFTRLPGRKSIGEEVAEAYEKWLVRRGYTDSNAEYGTNNHLYKNFNYE